MGIFLSALRYFMPPALAVSLVPLVAIFPDL